MTTEAARTAASSGLLEGIGPISGAGLDHFGIPARYRVQGECAAAVA